MEDKYKENFMRKEVIYYLTFMVFLSIVSLSILFMVHNKLNKTIDKKVGEVIEIKKEISNTDNTIPLSEIEKRYHKPILDTEERKVYIYPHETKLIKQDYLSVYTSFITSDSQIFSNIIYDCTNRKLIILAARKYDAEGKYQGNFDEREHLDDYLNDDGWVKTPSDSIASIVEDYVCK